jgi:FixJ family two-component response regulator
VEFLSSIDKTAASQLIEKLLASLSDRQQDLAELGVTEYTIESLARKLNIAPKHSGSATNCN